LTDLLVLGAGPAGLGAAYRAASRGLTVTVLERADRVGGAAGSFEFAGVRVDHGSHRLHPSIDERILKDLRRLLGNDLQRRPRNGRIRLMNRWIGFPLGPGDLVRHMPRSFAARAAGDALLSPLRRPREDTFEEVLRAGLGPTICNGFYFPYARKIWGREPRELAGEQARRRVTADSPWKMIRRVLRGSGEGGDRGSSYFYYPRRGYGQISEVLADAAREAGADLRLDTAAREIRTDGSGVDVETVSGPIRADRLFSTIPLPVLTRALGPPEDILEHAAGLRSRAMLLVYLALDVPRFTEFDAHYFPEPFTPVTRVSEPKNYRDGDDPRDRTVLCAEIPCDTSEALWDAPADRLAEKVAEGLGEAGLPAVNPVEVHVERLPSAYPVYDLGFEERFARVDEWVSAHDRVLTFGRQGLFAHDNAHHALAMAYAATDSLRADGSFDRDHWTRAREAFRSHVVED
jgi:protoporphyrinogen oxidase